MKLILLHLIFACELKHDVTSLTESTKDDVSLQQEQRRKGRLSDESDIEWFAKSSRYWINSLFIYTSTSIKKALQLRGG